LYESPIATFLGAQFILDHESQFPDLVQRDPTNGAITVVIDPSFNLAGAAPGRNRLRAIYILDSTIFGGPDWGRLTFTVNGTYLNTFDLVVFPGQPAINLAGHFCRPRSPLAVRCHGIEPISVYSGMVRLTLGWVVSMSGRLFTTPASIMIRSTSRTRACPAAYALRGRKF
jgi:hypothetical protein